MQDYKAGDILFVKTDGEEFQGTAMPPLDSNILVLKLKNGYNIGIQKDKIKEIKVLGSTSSEKSGSKDIKQDSTLKKILILHTGGTIASKVSYATGGVVARFEPADLLEMVPELKKIANIETRLIRNMFSEDINFSHYNLLSKEIEKEVKSKKFKGIIITHGTDTMHYTSAALSFMLHSLPIPVVLVGAQRSSDRGSSDAFMNLICASQFILNSDFKGVCICMHGESADESCDILPGVNARKLHSSRRDAFKAVNSSKIASVAKTGSIKNFKKHHLQAGDFKLTIFNEKLKIGILKSHPNMFAEEIYAYKNFNGLIIEGTGLGHFPINEIDEFTKEHTKILKAIKELSANIPVVMATQCIFGIVNMNVYETGRKLIEAGVLGNMSTMTAETAFIKLAWLLSNKAHEAKKLINENLCNELSSRTEFEKEFI